jgi:hypothetical protein
VEEIFFFHFYFCFAVEPAYVCVYSNVGGRNDNDDQERAVSFFESGVQGVGKECVDYPVQDR